MEAFIAWREYKSNQTHVESQVKNLHMVHIPKLLKMCLGTKHSYKRLKKKDMKKKCCSKLFWKE